MTNITDNDQLAELLLEHRIAYVDYGGTVLLSLESAQIALMLFRNEKGVTVTFLQFWKISEDKTGAASDGYIDSDIVDCRTFSATHSPSEVWDKVEQYLRLHAPPPPVWVEFVFADYPIL